MSGPVPELSVVVPALNAAASIAVQLEALAGQEWSRPWEVVVADNGSTDDTVAVARRFTDRIPGLRVVDASRKRGAAHARNVGVRAAAGAAVAFCDADDEVGAGWVAAVGEGLRRHQVVASRQELDKLNEPWLRDSRGPGMSEGLPTLWFPPYLPHAGAYGLGIRRPLHDAVEGFDESLKVLEDTDYCVRVQLLGAELVFLSDAVVHYRYRTGAAEFRQARSYAEACALLQKRYSEPGSTLPGQRGWPLRGWRLTARALPRAYSRAGRARLVWALGWQVGRFVGSARHRIRAV